MAGAETVNFSSDHLWLPDEHRGLDRHTIPSVLFFLCFFPYAGVGITNLYLKCSPDFCCNQQKTLSMWRLLDNGLMGRNQLTRASKVSRTVVGFECMQTTHTHFLMVLKTCGMLMLFPFSDGQLSYIF